MIRFQVAFTEEVLREHPSIVEKLFGDNSFLKTQMLPRINEHVELFGQVFEVKDVLHSISKESPKVTLGIFHTGDVMYL